MNRRPHIVLAFGAFDLLHAGHRSFLRQAKRLGQRLIVAIGRDRIVTKFKGRAPFQSEQRRRARVAALRYVNQALLASRDPRRRFSFIKRLRPTVIALGYDQTHYTANLPSQLRRHGIKARVVRLQPYKPGRYKSSIIRKSLVRNT